MDPVLGTSIGSGRTPRESSEMMNFLFGAAAGALIASVGTITALRHPDFQVRLGLRPAVVAAPIPASRAPESTCPPAVADHNVGSVDMLLSRRRFWSIAPDKAPTEPVATSQSASPLP